MINDSFDTSKPLFTSKDNFESHGIKPIEKKTNTCIVTYSEDVKKEILSKYENEIACFTATANNIINVYYLKELNVLFYMSPVCAPAAACILDEVAYVSGAKNFIFFGSCGILINDAKDKVIIPTKAYRDEGTSYHYLKASDFIDIKNHNLIEEVCKNNNIHYIKGYTWTTDAIYRETINNLNKRRETGCISVEMEISALQAVSDYLGLNLYTFLLSGDILADEWNRDDLCTEKEKCKQLSSFEVAILISKKIK